MPDTNTPPTRVAESEAITRLPELLDRVQRGEEIVITRDGKPAVRLSPAPPAPTHDVEAARAAVERLLAIGRQVAARADPPITLEEILSWRHEGHRY
jgi:prevent-host-death family protein